MSELKPCPCCNSQAVYNKAKELGANGHIHCPVCSLSLDGFHFDNDDLMLKAWNRRSDTSALLRGARIGLDMAAKYHSAEADEWSAHAQEAEDHGTPGVAARYRDYRQCHRRDASAIRAIPDTDIMKEISRE